MSNNPGRRGKPAPWTIRENEHRRQALEAFFVAHHPAYAAYREARHAASKGFRDQGQELYPGEQFFGKKVVEYANRKLRAWGKRHPNPLTWEEHQRLEAEFTESYVRVDFS